MPLELDGCPVFLRTDDAARPDEFQGATAVKFGRPVHRHLDRAADSQFGLGRKFNSATAEVYGAAGPVGNGRAASETFISPGLPTAERSAASSLAAVVPL